jgi:hypothetical protein
MMKKMTLEQHAKLPPEKAHGKNAKGFKKGGPTTEDRLKMGKNMSRAMNQKSG